jgi:hypothetical protein
MLPEDKKSAGFDNCFDSDTGTLRGRNYSLSGLALYSPRLSVLVVSIERSVQYLRIIIP